MSEEKCIGIIFDQYDPQFVIAKKGLELTNPDNFNGKDILFCRLSVSRESWLDGGEEFISELTKSLHGSQFTFSVYKPVNGKTENELRHGIWDLRWIYRKNWNLKQVQYIVDDEEKSLCNPNVKLALFIDGPTKRFFINEEFLGYSGNSRR